MNVSHCVTHSEMGPLEDVEERDGVLAVVPCVRQLARNKHGSKFRAWKAEHTAQVVVL